MSDNKLLLSLQRLNQHDLSGYVTAEKRDVLGIITGVLVAMRLPLPTTPVTEVVNYYVSTHEPVAAKMFDQVNSQLFINTLKAAEVARNVYMFRYRAVYDDEFVLKFMPLIFNNSIAALPAGVSELIGKVTPEVMAKATEYYF